MPFYNQETIVIFSIIFLDGLGTARRWPHLLHRPQDKD